MAGDRQVIALATGGTGGHVFPAKALAEELLARGYRVVVLTDRRGEAFGEMRGNFEVRVVQAGGLSGIGLLRRLRNGLKLAAGFFQARAMLNELRPAAVVGFGGYASIPTMLAATTSHLPTMIHEQNAVLGRANRLLASKVDRIATSFESTAALRPQDARKVETTGNPVRDAIARVGDVYYPAPEPNGMLNILVFGGSQGARVFSEVMPQAVCRLDEPLRWRVHVIQQCRPEDLARVRQIYQECDVKSELASFFDDLPDRMMACQLVVCRAGASTVAELTAAGRPAVLVPYTHAIDDHQTANAHALDEAGAAWLMPEETFTAERLAERLEALLTMPGMLEAAAAGARNAGRIDAAVRLADLVETLLPANGGRNGEPDPHERREAA